jgi:hypothetical protein
MSAIARQLPLVLSKTDIESTVALEQRVHQSYANAYVPIPSKGDSTKMATSSTQTTINWNGIDISNGSHMENVRVQVLRDKITNHEQRLRDRIAELERLQAKGSALRQIVDSETDTYKTLEVLEAEDAQLEAEEVKLNLILQEQIPIQEKRDALKKKYEGF